MIRTIASNVVTAVLVSAFWILAYNMTGTTGPGEVQVAGDKQIVGRDGRITIAEGVVVGPSGLAIPVAGYINEHAPSAQILPALAPYLFPASFDRRLSPRVPLGVPVSYRSGQTIATAVTLNLARGGLAIRTLSPLGPGLLVELKFRVPGKAEIDVRGRVVWADAKVGMGIQFERVSAVDQRSIDALTGSR